MISLDSVKYDDLDGKFFVLKNVSASGDMYNDNGVGYLLFGITNNNIYKITYDEIEDPTKGELVVTGDENNKLVTWAQDHNIENMYDSPSDSVYEGYAQSKYYGNDLGYPLVAALHEHIVGTYNIVSYDPNLVTEEDLISALTGTELVAAPTNVVADPTTDGANVTAD